jgi:hypothetical protein
MKKVIIKRIIKILSPLLAVCILLCFVTALSNVNEGKALKDKTQLEEALRRAAVSCYAIEGAYPPSLEYLVENYAVSYDSDRFVVKYELFASNLMPDITVLDFKR